METIRMDDIDLFEMVNHFLTVRGRSFRTRWLQNGGRLQRRCRRRQHRLKLPTPLSVHFTEIT